jgi:hypothetical protein
MRITALWLAAWTIAASAHVARAQSDASEGDERALVATAAGAAIATAALGAGGATLATHEGEADRKVGAYTLLAGLAPAPITSHAIAGEWDRAALFGVVPIVGLLGGAWMIERAPVLLGRGHLEERRALALCYGVTLLSSAIGLFDTMNAGERRRERARSLAIAPWVGRDRFGVALGGSL